MTTLAAPAAIEQVRTPADGGAGPGARRSRLRPQPGWPLLILFAGIPLWWVLGLFQTAFFVLTIPMLVHLLRRRRAVVPDGFGLWLLLLVWIIGGVLVLQVDAPGAIPGVNSARFMTFSFRFAWYLCATVALLYTINTIKTITSGRIAYAVGWMFVSLVGAGLLALVAPALQFATPVEMLLPRSLANNDFVNSLVHAQVSQQQDFLGYVAPRVSAPFPYANQWGIAMAATAPHFIVGWWQRGGKYKIVTPVIAALAIIPIVGSLNRGMWGAFVAMIVYGLVRSGVFRRPVALATTLVGLVTVVGAVALSPLGTLIVSRLNTPHSNEIRENLGALTVESVLAGSPFMGYGATRNVQGNFNSIAYGASPECPKCSPPPLGTQGNLWELIFGAGFVGLLLYIAFMLTILIRYGRTSSPIAIAAQCTMIAVLVTSPVYNLVHPVMVVLLIAIGLLVRESKPPPERDLRTLLQPIRRGIPVIIVAALLGAFIGAAIQQQRGTGVEATLKVLVPTSDLIGVPSARPLSLDSEALLVRSQTALDQAVAGTGVDPDDLSARVRITAEPNTRILVLHVQAPTAAEAVHEVEELATAYLDLRADLLSSARDDLRERLEVELAGLGDALATAEGAIDQSPSGTNPALVARAAAIREQSATVAASLAQLEGSVNAGTPVSSVQVLTLRSPWVIGVSSGLMLGLLAGICLAWVLDGRIRWLHANRRVALGLPVVDRLSTASDGYPDARAVARAGHVVGIYTPLAGIVGDTSSPVALELAETLDAGLTDESMRSGSRVLVVTTRRALAHSLERTRRSLESAGLNPVGVILVND